MNQEYRLSGIKVVSVSVFLVVAGLASSCTFYDHYYIRLGGDMVVDALGHTEMISYATSDDIPLRYRLKREKYGLIAEIDVKTYRPAISFRVDDETQTEVHISGKFQYDCFGNFFPPDDPNEATYLNYPNSAYFKWYDNKLTRCRDAQPPVKSEQVLVITLSDFSGAVIGEERIPFTLEKEGVIVSGDLP